MSIYEVDLRERETGNSVACIYSGNDYDSAYNLCESFNKTLPDYNYELGFGEYYDGISDGLFADLYVIENERYAHGIGIIKM